MSVGKIIEITAASEKSFEDAIRAGIARACKTVEDVQGAWVKEQKVVVEKGNITEYRVDLKITFLLHGGSAVAASSDVAKEGSEQ